MARYQYTSAARVETADHAYPQRHTAPQRSFEVLEGQGLDARVRESVSSEFLSKIKMVLAVALLVVTVGVVRVGLCAATVSTLQATSMLESKLDTAEALESQLKVERSVMYSSSRIDKIATQNYGMVKATASETIDVSDSSATSDATSATQANGDAVQSSDEAQADAAVA